MTKGPAGYGRYDSDPEHIGCPRAKSDMSPCIARDGDTALSSGEAGRVMRCVGCDETPSVAMQWLKSDLPEKQANAISVKGHPKAVANRLRDLVRAVTDPNTVIHVESHTEKENKPDLYHVAWLLWCILQGYMTPDDRKGLENWLRRPESLMTEEDIRQRDACLEAAGEVVAMVKAEIGTSEHETN